MSLTVNPNTLELQIHRGDDETLRVTVKNSSGVAYDVSSNSFKFTVKDSVDDAIADAKFQLLNPAANGIDLTLAATGIVDVVFAAAHTSALAGRYIYDLEMTDTDGAHTLMRGAFVVVKDISTPGSGPATPTIVVPFTAGFAVTPPYYIYSSDDGLWHKFNLLDDGFGNITIQDVGQNATYPF